VRKKSWEKKKEERFGSTIRIQSKKKIKTDIEREKDRGKKYDTASVSAHKLDYFTYFIILLYDDDVYATSLDLYKLSE